MSNIRVDVEFTIQNGTEVSFTAPCDCSEVTGLKVYHQGGSKEFAFTDSHGNVLHEIGNVFAAGAVVKVILDVSKGHAYIQNADTNAYIERTFVKKASIMKLSHSALDDDGAWTSTGVTSYPTRPGIYRCTGNCPNLPVGVNGYGTLEIINAGGYALHWYSGNEVLYFAGSTTYDDTIAVPASWKVAGGTKKLWENASPTSRFIPQTITLSGYTQFNAIIVLYKAHISFDIGGDWAQTLIIGRPGKAYCSQLYDTGVYPQNVERMYEWNSSGIAFGSGCYHQGTIYSVSNDFAIPIAIYGI